ncbi:MAG: anti-sigma factor antagonist [Phycisphaerales bacterium]|nr:anti-sigma factor antagonist [Phycisphaerales bacterium]
MALSDWSETVIVGDLTDEPQLSEDLGTLAVRLESSKSPLHVVLDMSKVTYLTSSNLAQLIQTRKFANATGGSLHLCGVADAVWSILLMTGLDRLFKFSEDVSTGLAAAQLGL